MQIHYHWGQTTSKKKKKKKKESYYFEECSSSKSALQIIIQQIKKNSAHQLWLEWQQGSLHSFFWIMWTKEICLVLKQSWKKVYSRTTTKSVPLLQPKDGFCQQNGSERGQVQYWYPNGKVVVVLVCLNGRCCFLECVGIVSY